MLQPSSTDLVSIVIPVYNTGEYLIECLQSCLNQTHANVEVVAVDDRSTDARTIEILKEFESKDSRIKVIWSKENHGQGYCRNIGVEQCTGKYFAFIDSDDYFKPDFVEKMYQGLEQYQTDFAMCDTFNYVDDPKLYEIKKYKLLDAETRFNFNAKDRTVVDTMNLASMGFLLKFPVSCYGKMFNTQKYKASGLRFNDGEFSRHCQDEDWGVDSILKLKNFVVLKFTGVMRRMHYQTASTPSQEYFYCSVNAVYRSSLLIKAYPFYHIYEQPLLKSLLLRFYMLCSFTKTYEERLKIIDLAHDYLIKFGHKLNVNPYSWFYIIGKGWYDLSSALDNKPLPVVYFSMCSLHDTYWHESYASKQLLENLAANGIKVMAFTGLSNTSQAIINQYANIESTIVKVTENDLEHQVNESSALLQFKDNGVAYFVAKTSPLQKPSSFTQLDHRILNEGLDKLFESNCRDKQSCVFLVSGGDTVTQKYCLKLKELGAKLVYLIDAPEALHFENAQSQDVLNLNGDCSSLEQAVVPDNMQYVFAPQEFDAVLSMHPYYAQRFTELYGVQAEALGYAVNPQVVAAREGQHNFITFANPTVEHGLAVVIKLAASFSKLHPEQKFLIVQDQEHNLPKELQKLHDSAGQNLSQLKLPLGNLMITSDKQFDPISVATQTRVLLSPSLNCNVSIANLLECKCNDIPVLSSNTAKHTMLGKLVARTEQFVDKQTQFVNKQDQFVAVPESVLKDPYCLPSDEEIEPWIKALELMLNTERSIRSTESRQNEYQQSIQTWMSKLYSIAGITEEHDYPDDVRGLH